MSRPLVGEFNCETQEQTVREMNDEEYAQYLIDQENFNKMVSEGKIAAPEIEG